MTKTKNDENEITLQNPDTASSTSKHDFKHSARQNDTLLVTNETNNIDNAPKSKDDPLLLLKIITLGDGDFSWSLDLARYLYHYHNYRPKQESTIVTKPIITGEDPVSNAGEHTCKAMDNRTHHGCQYELCATGIDNYVDIERKYPHSKSFILPQLLKFNDDKSIYNGQNDRSNIVPTFKVKVRHEVNAIQSPKSTNENEQYNIVMFHHPHLGVEDCILHNQFLYHFFHSVRYHWWIQDDSDSTTATTETTRKSIKLLYLTLASGQYERWKCHEVATKYNFQLYQRCYFVPQPSSVPSPAGKLNGVTKDDNGNGNTNCYYYEQRRHQSGKSFARRVQGPSETLIYTDALCPISELPIPLPWFVPVTSLNESNKINNAPPNQLLLYPCPFCDKHFEQERSRKNHVLSKHPNETVNCDNETIQPNKKRKRKRDDRTINNHPNDSMDSCIPTTTQKKNAYTCPYCTESTSSSTSDNNIGTTNIRLFQSQEALNDHIRAKHEAIHSDLSPDHESYKTTKAASPANNVPSFSQTLVCDICGYSVGTSTATTTGTTDDNLDSSAVLLEKHMQCFIPVKEITSQSSSDIDDSTTKCVCQFCNKVFQQKRAQMQHENFCKHRK